MGKTQLWSPDPRAVLPDEYAQYAQYRVSTLKAVGSTLAYVRDYQLEVDWRDIPLTDFMDPEALARRSDGLDGRPGGSSAGGTGVSPGAPAQHSCGQSFLT